MARNSNANCSTSRSRRKWPTSTASFAVRAMACKRPRCCETTYARIGPSRSSSSAAAATKTHPPGSEGSVAQGCQTEPVEAFASREPESGVEDAVSCLAALRHGSDSTTGRAETQDEESEE